MSELLYDKQYERYIAQYGEFLVIPPVFVELAQAQSMVEQLPVKAVGVAGLSYLNERGTAVSVMANNLDRKSVV